MRSITSRNTWITLAGMALGLALFARGGTLPLMAPGLLLFGALALLHPELGLLFVPLTAPLYLIPVSIPGIRASGEFLLPLSEVVLPIVLAGTAAGWLWRLAGAGERAPLGRRGIGAAVVAYAPHLLLLLAGLFGAAVATADRGAALRELRRVIVEPLIFYALLKLYLAPGASAEEPAAPFDPPYAIWMAGALSLSGALVALLGLFQAAGLDVVPYLGTKRSFSENVVVAGATWRVTSVYGHPNNLGLYLGRIWPLAAALWASMRSADLSRDLRIWRGAAWFFGLCALLCLGGILVSFSRGAWLGAAGALAVLALVPLRRRFGSWLVPGLAALCATLAIAAGLGLTRSQVSSTKLCGCAAY